MIIKKQLHFLSILFCALVMVVSCKSKIPSDVIAPEVMKTVVFDLMVAQQVQQSDTSAAIRLHLRDSSTRIFRKVLAIHHIDKSKYFKSLDFYEANPDILKAVLDSAKSYGTVLQDSLRSKKTRARTRLDSINRLKADTLSKKVDSLGQKADSLTKKRILSTKKTDSSHLPHKLHLRLPSKVSISE